MSTRYDRKLQNMSLGELYREIDRTHRRIDIALKVAMVAWLLAGASKILSVILNSI